MLREMKRLTKNLLENSIQAFILALETINRPSISYRMEAFCFLFCNSWELLMKAKILNEGHKIFYRKKRKQPRRSLSLDDCLKHIFTTENDPIKFNLERISELRNNAIHLVIPFVPNDIMGLFQAGVINYPKFLQEWFAIRLSDRVPLGMMALIYDFDPKEHSLEFPKIRRKLTAETVQYFTNFQKAIREQAVSFGNDATQFYIPINLKLAIVKNPSEADIVLSSSTTGEKTLITEVPKHPDKTHPYNQTEVIKELLVNQKLAGITNINSYDIYCVRKVFKIDNKADLYYTSKRAAPQYSDKFVEWIVNQVTKNPDFFNRVRSTFKKELESGKLS